MADLLERTGRGRQRRPRRPGLTAHPGFPTGDELADRYAARTGRDIAHLPFYRAFADWKLAVILEGVHARYLAGSPSARGTTGSGLPCRSSSSAPWPASPERT